MTTDNAQLTFDNIGHAVEAINNAEWSQGNRAGWQEAAAFLRAYAGKLFADNKDSEATMVRTMAERLEVEVNRRYKDGIADIKPAWVFLENAEARLDEIEE